MYHSVNKTKLIIIFLLIFIVCYVNFCLYLVKYKRDKIKLSSCGDNKVCLLLLDVIDGIN